MKIKFLGENSKRSLEKRVKKVAGAGHLSHFEGNVFEAVSSPSSYEEDLKIIRAITKSGHESIIEHDCIQIGLSEVTPIVEQILIGFRLTSFTIKSRRYVDFRKVGYYVPAFRNADYSLHMENKILRQKYRRNATSLFKLYSEMVDSGIPKEDARFILPYSFYSDIFMTLNARELKKVILYCMYGEVSKIQEVYDLGKALLEIAREHIPYIVSYIENYKVPEKAYDYQSLIKKHNDDFEVLPKPVLLDYTTSPDDVILELAVMYETQCNYDDAWKIIVEAEKEDPDFRKKYMDAIIRKNESRELEQVSFTWQIPISLSILTHLTRHREHSLMTPNFVPLWNMNNYLIPESVKNSEFAMKYQKAVEKNLQLVEEFKKAGVVEEDLVYFYLGCQMCNVVTTINGRELMWISRMRTCNRAQWQIRNIANDMMDEARKVAPLLGRGLGPTCKVFHYCPEGKLSCGLIKEILAEEQEANAKK